MREVLALLKPRFLSFKNRRISKNLKGRKLRFFILGTIGFAFWAGAFAIFYRVLTYFQRIEGLGDILAYKLLSMALITFFSLLIFSGILTSLAKLYLSKDLSLVHSMPVSRGKIFLSRWIESTMDSSWMVLIYSLPLFLSYGIVYKVGVSYYAMVAVNICTLLPDCIEPQRPHCHVGGSIPAGRSYPKCLRLYGAFHVSPSHSLFPIDETGEVCSP